MQDLSASCIDRSYSYLACIPVYMNKTGFQRIIFISKRECNTNCQMSETMSLCSWAGYTLILLNVHESVFSYVSKYMIILYDTSPGICSCLCAHMWVYLHVRVFVCTHIRKSAKCYWNLTWTLEVLGIIPARKSHPHQLFKLDFPLCHALLFL